ncbi:MAG TPA: hypothetical protein VGK70_09995 [Thermoanaerobaculia bacterium]
MRLTIVRLLMALALAGVWPASAEGAKKMNADEKAISDLHKLFATAWSKSDTVAAAATYAEDGVRVGAFGDVQHGRAEI